MTFPAHRFFSLSTSSSTNNNPSSAVSGAPNNAPTSTSILQVHQHQAGSGGDGGNSNSSSIKFADHKSLDLLVRAVNDGLSGSRNNNSFEASSTMTWLNNNSSSSSSSNSVPNLGGGGGSEAAAPQATSNSSNNNNNSNNPNNNTGLYATATSQSDQAICGGVGNCGFSSNFNSNSNLALKAQSQQPPQFGQLFGDMNNSSPRVHGQQQWNTNTTTANTNSTTSNSNTNLAAQVNAQANVISQLVASLQAQQQAQVQVALARAFGTTPGGVNNSMEFGQHTTNGMNSMQAAAMGNMGNYVIGAGEQQGIPGLMSSSLNTSTNNTSNSMVVDSLGGAGGSLQQDNLLSRVQLAQRAQQQQHQVVQQQQAQQVQAAQLMQQMQQQQMNTPFDATAAVAMGAFHPNATGTTMNVASLAAAAAAAASTMPPPLLPLVPHASSAATLGSAAVSSSTTADESIKLRFEHEQHKRMLQMVQGRGTADRQQSPQQQAQVGLLSNQVAAQQLMKKARWDINGSGGVGRGATGMPDASINDAIKTMFQQQQQHSPVIVGNPTLAAAFPHHGNLLANAAGLIPAVQNFAKLGSIAGLNHHQELENTLQAAAHNHHLMNTVGLPTLAGLGGPTAVGGVVGDTTSSDLVHHPKFGASSYGAAIVPCRARGMPVDHNFKTAYFVIPEDSEHGDELMCTYPACRNAGVKFRYCLHCKVPVAKRNFRNRHRHGVLEDCSDEEDASDEEEETCEGGTSGSGEGGGTSPGSTSNIHGDICQPVGGGNVGRGVVDDDEDYTGVKKEHILIIPGVGGNNTNPSNPSSNNNPNTDSMNKKKKKKNGKLRVPCRARGLPMAHNFKSAYFIIPPNIEHGDELLCSFPLCRSAGAKFRYCLHCKVPVAKRNFRNRHKHGKGTATTTVKSGSENANDGDETMSEKKQEVGNHEGEEMYARDGVKPAGDRSSRMGSSSTGDAFPPPLEPLTNALTPSPASFPSVDIHSDAGMESSSKVNVSSSHDVTKVQKWVELLENKPNPEDKEAMAVWMANLMNATNGDGGGATAAAAIESSATATEMPSSSAADVGTLKVETVVGSAKNDEDEDVIASTLMMELGQPSKNDASQQESASV